MNNNYAGLWPRLAATAIDGTVLLIPAWIGLTFDPTGLTSVATMSLYHAGFEGSKKQATIGKQVMRIKVADKDGNRISFLRALVRVASLIWLPILTAFVISAVIALTTGNLQPEKMMSDYLKLYGAALLLQSLFVLWTSRKQALYDLVSGCVLYRYDKKPRRGGNTEVLVEEDELPVAV
ncbi:MAG: RDD family protein [Ignavibacteriales bacterium]